MINILSLPLFLMQMIRYDITYIISYAEAYISKYTYKIQAEKYILPFHTQMCTWHCTNVILPHRHGVTLQRPWSWWGGHVRRGQHVAAQTLCLFIESRSERRQSFKEKENAGSEGMPLSGSLRKPRETRFTPVPYNNCYHTPHLCLTILMRTSYLHNY